MKRSESPDDIETNVHVGFPEHDPQVCISGRIRSRVPMHLLQVFDLFWTPGQMAARSHQ